MFPEEGRETRRPGIGTPDGLKVELPVCGCCWEKTKLGMDSEKTKRRSSTRKESFFTTISPLELYEVV
jgi:hypothetical protein